MNSQNVFAGAYVERHGHLREDSNWLRDAVRSDSSWFVPVWGEWCLASGEPMRTVLLRRTDVETFIDENEIIFLGMYREQPAFAIHIDRSQPAPFADRGDFHDLRYLGSVLPVDEANLVAHARALVIWHGVQRFCGRCGTATRPSRAATLASARTSIARCVFFPASTRQSLYWCTTATDACSAGSPAGRKVVTPPWPASWSRVKALKTPWRARCRKKLTFV